MEYFKTVLECGPEYNGYSSIPEVDWTDDIDDERKELMKEILKIKEKLSENKEFKIAKITKMFLEEASKLKKKQSKLVIH